MVNNMETTVRMNEAVAHRPKRIGEAEEGWEGGVGLTGGSVGPDYKGETQVIRLTSVEEISELRQHKLTKTQNYPRIFA